MLFLNAQARSFLLFLLYKTLLNKIYGSLITQRILNVYKIIDDFTCQNICLRYLSNAVSRRFHRFFRNIPFKTSSCYEQETSSRHWIPGQYERPPHQPQLNSTVSQLCSLRTRGVPSATGVKSLHIIGGVHSSQGSFSCIIKIIFFSSFP